MRAEMAPSALQLPAGCTGDCDAGTRDCTCAHAVIGMWDDELAHPGLACALVAAAAAAALLLSRFWPWGFAA